VAFAQSGGGTAGRMARNPPTENEGSSPTAMQPPAPHASPQRNPAPPAYWAEPGTPPEIGTIAPKLKLLSPPTATHEVEHATLPRSAVPGTAWYGPATPSSMATTPPPIPASAPTATQWEASVQAREWRDTLGEMNWAGPAVPSVMATTKPPTDWNVIPPATTHVPGLGQAMALRKSVPAMT